MRRVLYLAWLIVLLAAPARAQIQIGTIKGIVTDQTGAVLPGAVLTLDNSIAGSRRPATTNERGEFAFNNVPPATYSLRVEAPGFQFQARSVQVRSNLPLTVEFRLSVSGQTGSATVVAREALVPGDEAQTQVELDENFLQRRSHSSRGGQWQALIATTPGWTTQNNGLLHVRGVDDGILYVVDGVPTTDRVDAISASAFEAEMVSSLRVLTGNIPAEFGGRSGAVVTIQPRSGVDLPLTGSLSAATGSFRAGELSATVGGGYRQKFGFFISSTASRSDRFLDPVDLGNFNNRSGGVKLNQRFDWHPTGNDVLLFNVSLNGTDFRVPNRLEQQVAGQRQRQELRDNSQSVSWQHLWSSRTVSNLAYFRREYESRLFGSELDTPVFAAQDRHHTRQGVIGSLTQQFSRHLVKVGFEAARLAPREFFTFAITAPDDAEEEGVSEAALAFDRDDPFVFREHRKGSVVSWYAQDTFSPLRNLTLNAGLRYDRSSLPVVDEQLSPRLGAVYFVPKLRTALRASFNRLYMPPQLENLLLAASEPARRLSPFATPAGGGNAPIRPEKTSAYEVGFAQDVRGWFKLDAAYWWRNFRNFADPNVFFNTTIIFPNSVAKGFARGLDVRLDVPERKGWSGYLSYTNQRILQTGPLNGGLFLTDEFVEIAPGKQFIPDHDQRNVGAFGLTYARHRKGRWGTGYWLTFGGRHESGVPLQVEADQLAELRAAPGAELVDFERRRVRPWTTFDLAGSLDLYQTEAVTVSLQMDWQNVADKQFAYNFGSPFEGTHFGHPRLWSGRVKVSFR